MVMILNHQNMSRPIWGIHYWWYGLQRAGSKIRKALWVYSFLPWLALVDRIFNDLHSLRIMHKLIFAADSFIALPLWQKVGFQNDGRSRELWSILGAQREDGDGYLQDVPATNWTRSCPFASYGAALALILCEEWGVPEIHEMKALEFLVMASSTKQPGGKSRDSFITGTAPSTSS